MTDPDTKEKQDRIELPDRGGPMLWVSLILGSGAVLFGLALWVGLSADFDFELGRTLILAGFIWVVLIFCGWWLLTTLDAHEVLRQLKEREAREKAAANDEGDKPQ